jgi:hypothetical protein
MSLQTLYVESAILSSVQLHLQPESLMQHIFCFYDKREYFRVGTNQCSRKRNLHGVAGQPYCRVSSVSKLADDLVLRVLEDVTKSNRMVASRTIIFYPFTW